LDNGGRGLPDELGLGVDYLKGLKECAGLPEAELCDMARRAIEIGAKQAEAFAGGDIEQQAQRFKVTLKMLPGGLYGQRLIRAQYDHSAKDIRIYQQGVETVLSTPAPELLGIECSVEAVREVLLWHEFFHVLEFHKIGLVGRQFRIPGKALFGFARTKPLYRISEICANAFAMRVMGLRRNPFLIDYVLGHRELWEKKEVQNDDD